MDLYKWPMELHFKICPLCKSRPIIKTRRSHTGESQNLKRRSLCETGLGWWRSLSSWPVINTGAKVSSRNTSAVYHLAKSCFVYSYVFTGSQTRDSSQYCAHVWKYHNKLFISYLKDPPLPWFPNVLGTGSSSAANQWPACSEFGKQPPVSLKTWVGKWELN